MASSCSTVTKWKHACLPEREKIHSPPFLCRQVQKLLTDGPGDSSLHCTLFDFLAPGSELNSGQGASETEAVCFIWVILNEMLFLDYAKLKKKPSCLTLLFLSLRQVSSSSAILKTGFDFLDNW